MVRASSPCAAASKVMFRNPGPAISTACDAWGLAEPTGQDLSDLARWASGRLGQLQRHVGGVVAVIG